MLIAYPYHAPSPLLQVSHELTYLTLNHQMEMGVSHCTNEKMETPLSEGLVQDHTAKKTQQGPSNSGLQMLTLCSDH